MVTYGKKLSSYGVMSLDPDQPYIAQTLNGDTHAFSVLVDRYKYMVYTLAFRILKNKEDAEEVAQDTFVKLYKRLPQFKGDSKFSTWLYKIAYYGSLDVLKKRKKNLETTSIDNFTGRDLRDEINEAAPWEANEQQVLIKRAIQQLNGEDGVVITLFYFEELSLEEIAKIMNLSANTVKVRLFRSRKRISEILSGFLETEKASSYERE